MTNANLSLCQLWDELHTESATRLATSHPPDTAVPATQLDSYLAANWLSSGHRYGWTGERVMPPPWQVGPAFLPNSRCCLVLWIPTPTALGASDLGGWAAPSVTLLRPCTLHYLRFQPHRLPRPQQTCYCYIYKENAAILTVRSHGCWMHPGFCCFTFETPCIEEQTRYTIVAKYFNVPTAGEILQGP